MEVVVVAIVEQACRIFLPRRTRAVPNVSRKPMTARQAICSGMAECGMIDAERYNQWLPFARCVKDNPFHTTAGA
jgi:hypothetical protein